MTREADAHEYIFLSEPSESTKDPGTGSYIENSWGLMMSQVQSGLGPHVGTYK